MKQVPRLLPIGISSFKSMIEENFIYVDKTQYIYDLVTQGKYYFLSRPRRFGKSLLISTLEQLFLGNKELFNSLFITTTNYDWPVHPVIHISFSSLSSKTAQDLEKDIAWTLKEIAQRYDINAEGAPSVQTKFSTLIKRLSIKNKVVILIDEYDYPLLNNIYNKELAEECRKVLHDFFAVLKDLGDYIRLVFITGVTKFSKTSIFSGLNNLDDLTLSKRSAQLLGYTESEIIHNFEPYIKDIASRNNTSQQNILKQIQVWYNGYIFTENNTNTKSSLKVYNPFSVLLYLKEGKLLNYWFETGTPTFLAYLIKTQEYPIAHIEASEVNIEEIKAYDIDKLKLIPLLWQTGYLTIKSYNSETKNYTLAYPNEEVKTSFLQYLMSYFTNTQISFLTNYIAKLTQALKHNDLGLFFETLQVFFANIPYTMQLPLEKYYQSIFYVVISLIGINIHAEVVTNEGRIDAVIETHSYIYLFEFKLTEPAEIALKQIEAKQYFQKYLHLQKKIILVGVQFNMEKRNLENWIIKNL